MFRIFKTKEPVKDEMQHKKWAIMKHDHVVMSELQIWQRDITKYDQFMRKMLAIRELGDLPYEVWQELLYSSPSNEFLNKAHTSGTSKYTHEIKLWCLRYAMEYYTKGYMELHKIQDLQEAKDRINTVLEKEVPVSEIWTAAIMIKQKIVQRAEQKSQSVGYNPYPMNGHEFCRSFAFPVNGYGY